MEAAANQAWIRTDQIEHNLNSSFMDHEDVWRKAFGSSIYKDLP